MTFVSKHAYLIMAHDNPSILEKLLYLLDDYRHDIYLHIDLRSKKIQSVPKMKESKLTIIDSKPVFWADYSQVDTTFRLLKSAVTSGYSYYHLLSGVDLPLKTNEVRYRFFENSKRNFIGIVPHESWYSVRRVKYYHPFLHNRFYRTSRLMKGTDRLLEYGQRIVGVNRLKGVTWKIIDGWTWFSIRRTLCQALIKAEDEIRQVFQSTIASDELFIHTFVYNQQQFRETLYDESDLKNGSTRYIDWHRGRPYIFGGSETENDYQLLMNSPYMFARKFSEDKSSELVERIYNRIMQEQQMNEKHNPNGFIEQ